jgi:hypothetical protein
MRARGKRHGPRPPQTWGAAGLSALQLAQSGRRLARVNPQPSSTAEVAMVFWHTRIMHRVCRYTFKGVAMAWNTTENDVVNIRSLGRFNETGARANTLVDVHLGIIKSGW